MKLGTTETPLTCFPTPRAVELSFALNAAALNQLPDKKRLLTALHPQDRIFGCRLVPSGFANFRRFKDARRDRSVSTLSGC